MVESYVHRRAFEFIPFVLVIANFVPRELEKAEIAAKMEIKKKTRPLTPRRSKTAARAAVILV